MARLAPLLLVSASAIREIESLLQVVNTAEVRLHGNGEWLFSSKSRRDDVQHDINLGQTELDPSQDSPTLKRAAAVTLAADLVADKAGATAKAYLNWALAAERVLKNQEAVASAQSEAQLAAKSAVIGSSNLEASSMAERNVAYYESNAMAKAQTQAFSHWQSEQNKGRIHAEKAALFRRMAEEASRQETEAKAKAVVQTSVAKARILAAAAKLSAFGSDPMELQASTDVDPLEENDATEDSGKEAEAESALVVADETEAMSEALTDARGFLHAQFQVGAKFKSKAKAFVAWAQAVERAKRSQLDAKAAEAGVSATDENATTALGQTDVKATVANRVDGLEMSTVRQAKRDTFLVAVAERRVRKAEAAEEEALAQAAVWEQSVLERAVRVAGDVTVEDHK